MDHKKRIIEILEQVKQNEIANPTHEPDKQQFVIRAYDTALNSLRNCKKQIHELEDVQDIKGIGAKLKLKIEEIIETGTLKSLQSKTSNDLMLIHGIGPAKVKELANEHNIKTIEELKNHPHLLNDKQQIGLKYHEHFQKRIPRKEMEKHDEYLKKVLAPFTKVLAPISIQIVGSYRRGARDSGDIDVIIKDSDVQDIVSKLKKDGYLIDDFANGPHKYMGVCRLKKHKYFRRIDILYADPLIYPFSLMYFTGSAEFNIRMRNYALSKGLSMNEYGIKKLNGEKIDKTFTTENDIFEYLGLEYVPPNAR